MKFTIELKKGQMECVEQMVGQYSGKSYVEKILKSSVLKDDGTTEDLVYLCCIGSFAEYLSSKKFFGKNQVHKWNW